MKKYTKESKIIFDESTKEIRIKEDDNKIRKWLEKNKIFFETLMTITLTIMGVIVSVISIIISYSIEKRNISIQEEQLNIALQSQLPHFYIISREQSNEIVDYKIVNSGAHINGAFLVARSTIEIRLLNGTGLGVSVEDCGRFLDVSSTYDSESQSFSIRKNIEIQPNLCYFLDEYLSNCYEDDVIIFTHDYINIHYTDMFGEKHIDWYELYFNDLEKIDTDPIADTSKFVFTESMTNEEICDIFIDLLNSEMNTE